MNLYFVLFAAEMAHFFSAFYKTLHKAIQQNISDVEG